MVKLNQSFFIYAKNQRIGLLIFFFLLLFIFSIRHFLFPSKNIVLANHAYHYQNNLNWLKPFNPNFLKDVKAYHLGLSVNEIDRLLEYRKQGKFVNSTQDFQKVTLVSDSVLKKIAPYFKFPKFKKYQPFTKYRQKIILKKDINTATLEDLIKVYGIGEKRAQLIINYRTKLGGFVDNSQLAEVWSLNAEVLKELYKYFGVLTKPIITTLNVNQVSVYELSKVPYLNYSLAKSILFYKREVAEIQSLEELKQIPDFPIHKFNIISLYLRVE